MSDAKALIREWLEITAMGPAEAWVGKAADDLVMRLPFAPPGVLAEMRGFDQARDTLAHHWGTKQSFQWRDVAIRETEEPGLFVTTARSEVVLANGAPYRNSYVMLTRVRDGKVVEHTEYFNPLPIIEMLGK
ncbi:MAG: nuclear transport factor 2 family protein [Novosphingobium sp.]